MTLSPCITCDTLTSCATCLPRLAWEGSQPDPEPSGQCLTCVDAEWLALAGEHPDQIAARLGFKGVGNLLNHLRKHGRSDTIRRTA